MRPMFEISHQHKQLIIPYREDWARLFFRAKPIEHDGQRKLAMPHGDEETRLLRNLGWVLPAPIEEHYHWPGTVKPFYTQYKTAALLTINPRAYVLNQMGTGKTKAALWAYDYLRSVGKVRRMLVVAPLSTLTFTWSREVMQTLPMVKALVLHGSRDKRHKLLADMSAHIYIVNHDGLQVVRDAVMLRQDIDVVCFDEIGAYRNAGAERSKIAQRVASGRKYVWGMTGSPTPNAPTDAYGLAKLITPGTAPKSFTHFRHETMINFNTFKWIPRKDAAAIVSDVLQPSVCYSLDEVVELPQTIQRPFDVIQGPDQRKRYTEMKKQAITLLKEGQITAANGGVVMSKLLQISSGYVYTDDKSTGKLDNDERLRALVELIDAAAAKVIVFAPFKHTVRGIAEALTAERLDFATITGDTPSGERDKIFNAFQATSKHDVLLAHPQCMAHGITLTAADTIIWFSPIASLDIFEQANARISRVGQLRKQQVFMMQGTEVERAVYGKLRSKHDVQSSVLDILSTLTED